MSDKPQAVSSKRGPYVVELEVGKYWWCACGRSQRQPLCDGSHGTSGFAPIGFEITEKRKVGLCGCRQSANPPFCDGSHAKLPKE